MSAIRPPPYGFRTRHNPTPYSKVGNASRRPTGKVPTMTKSRELTLREIRELVAFLPKLYAEGFTPITRWHIRNYDGTLCFPWPEYDELVERFRRAIWKFDDAFSESWFDRDHRHEKAGMAPENEGAIKSAFGRNYSHEEARKILENEDIIKSATLSQIRMMLSYYLGVERFCDGAEADMIEKGYIRRLLERLEAIASEMSKE